MKPLYTNATTTVLGAPSDWDGDNGECVGLPVHISDDPFVYSWWKLTMRERLLLLIGRPIQLCIVGRTHAPVALEVADVEQHSWWMELQRLWRKARRRAAEAKRNGGGRGQAL